MSERKLIRLPGFNYSVSRYYFFTIYAKNHNHFFGSIVNKSMHLSHNGIIAFKQWKWLGNQYPYIDLISFIIMPDKVHGIIHIDSDYYNHRIMWMDWCTGNVPYIQFDRSYITLLFTLNIRIDKKTIK
jgi:REP element-mobilizing transposase RayT